jgi:hypothetical protein
MQLYPNCVRQTFSLHHRVERAFLAWFTPFLAWLHLFLCAKKISFYNRVCPCFRYHTSNPLVNGISVLQIEIRSFVEPIRGYKMHYLSLNLEWVKMSKVAVWLGSTLKPWQPHKLNVHISLKSRSITLKIQSQREFWLLFLLVVSEFQNPLTMYGRFSRDAMKNPRILNKHFSILTITGFSPYEIVPTLKFSSSGAF